MQALKILVEVLLQSVRQAQDEADAKEKLENLLRGLLTPSEIQEFAQRIEIVKLLKKGVGQHEIAKKLKVGVATVTRGAKEIKQGNFVTVQ